MTIAATAAAQLTHHATINRRHVHRTSVADVFLTDTARLRADNFLFAAQLPRDHRYFDRAIPNADITLIAEVLRQATIALAHVHYDVPHDHRFVMSGIELELLPRSYLPTATPVDIVIECYVSNVTHRRDTLAALRNTLTFNYDGSAFATGTGDLTVLAPRIYERLRSGHRDDFTALSVPPYSAFRYQDVGAAHADHVVLDIDPIHTSSWRLRVDPGHGVFFDHPLDHVPGMLLIEAAVQASRAVRQAPELQPRALTGRFSKFFNLNESVRVVREPTVWPRLSFSIEQAGQIGAIVDIGVDP